MPYQPLGVTGPSGNRIDAVVVGDGYRLEDAAAFDAHAAAFGDYLFNGGLFVEPFDRYAAFFNLHGVRTVSADQGADDPNQGRYVDTALDASFAWGGGVDRLLYFNVFAADDWVDATLAGLPVDAVDLSLGVVNEVKFGGGGGRYAVWAGGAGDAGEIATHEIGHTLAGLADEYETGGPRAYTGFEPAQPNVTTDPEGSKWAHWHGYVQEGIGEIGAYEGGFYSEEGIWRPSIESKMRALYRPFDAVSREQFVLTFYDLVDPLDDWSFRTLGDAPGAVINLPTTPASFEIEPIDPTLFSIVWTLNGDVVTEWTGATAAPIATLNLAPGAHVLSVQVTDETDWVRLDRSSLSQTVTWRFEIAAAAETIGPEANALFGDAEEDLLRGSDQGDRLVGRRGDDAIWGDAGDDVLLGWSGDDHLAGGDGDDVLRPGPGADAVLGGAGDDRLRFDADDIEVSGGAGVDRAWVATREMRGVTIDLAAAEIERFQGGAGDDVATAADASFDATLRGRQGADTLIGGYGDDGLHGDQGADLLRGGAGDDRLWGGAENDILIGGPGDDRLWGDQGADLFEFRAIGDGDDRIQDFDVARDRVVFRGEALGVGPTAFEDLVITASGGDARIDYGAGSVILVGVDPAALDASVFDFL